MFSLFLVFTSCSAIVVTTQNFQETLGKDSNTPILTLFWSPYCGHCTHFKPTWRSLVDSSRFRTSIEFAEVNCVEQNKICGKYQVSGYPSLMFIIPSVQSSAKFKGSRSIANIDNFIEKYFKYPCIIVDEGLSLKKYIKHTVNYSLFYLQYKDDDEKKIFPIYQAFASRYEDSGAKFFATKTFTTKLEVYQNVVDHTEYKGDLTDRKQLNSFFSMHLYPTLPQLCQHILKESFKKNKMLMIFFLQSRENMSIFSTAVKQMNSSAYHYAFDIENETKKVSLISQHHIMKKVKVTEYPSLVLLNTKNMSYCVHKIQSHDFNKSIEEIIEWKQNISLGQFEWTDKGVDGSFELLKIRFRFLLENTSFVVFLCIVFSFLITMSVIHIIMYIINPNEGRKME